MTALTPYTTTITDEAARRGIRVDFLNSDPEWPIFDLSKANRKVRCFNALTDLVGSATFNLLNNKRACHQWLAAEGFPVPEQLPYAENNTTANLEFLRTREPLVVKPCSQWGGRGVSMGVRTPAALHAAVRHARKYEPDIIMEETVPGEDLRIILVGNQLAAAIRRTPAHVTGDGKHTIRQLILRQNAVRRKTDPSNLIPWDAETRRNLFELGLDIECVPPAGRSVRVRLTNNYHTGGTVEIVTDPVPAQALEMAQAIASRLDLPLTGVDFLIDATTGRITVIEVSPDMAISPPEGPTVARCLLDFLFPGSR
ncbi:MAG: ATP-grasp domain-containing protein [Kiritimatiellae bacterium]|nr:ATP-grasp domain-containing protein [Kiritimatiellia bacterium]